MRRALGSRRQCSACERARRGSPVTTTTSTYLAISNNLTRYQTMTADKPAVKTASEYYAANIGNVTSIQDFVGNYRLLSYALSAYGLGNEVNSTALVTQVLEGGVSSSNSLANTLSNPNWAKFAAAFDFVGQGVLQSRRRARSRPRPAITSSKRWKPTRASKTRASSSLSIFSVLRPR